MRERSDWDVRDERNISEKPGGEPGLCIIFSCGNELLAE